MRRITIWSQLNFFPLFPNRYEQRADFPYPGVTQSVFIAYLTWHLSDLTSALLTVLLWIFWQTLGHGERETAQTFKFVSLDGWLFQGHEPSEPQCLRSIDIGKRKGFICVWFTFQNCLSHSDPLSLGRGWGGQGLLSSVLGPLLWKATLKNFNPLPKWKLSECIS